MIKLVLFNAADFEKTNETPNLGLPYIAAYLREHLDLDIYILTSNVMARLRKIKPDIVAMSSITQYYTQAIAVTQAIKEEFNIPIILGGIHITLLPQSLSSHFDLAVIGEGELTMLELMELFFKYQGFPREKLSNIKGIAYYRDGQVFTTEKRPLIRDLDLLPFPARDLYNPQGFNLGIMTSRGCPFKCTYCSSTAFWGGGIRFFSSEYVVREIEELIEKHSAVFIHIWDDIFIVNKKRLEKIVTLIEEKGINKKISFRCSIRADLVTDDICSLLGRMNATQVSMGLESGSERILREFKGGRATPEGNKQAVNMLKKHGFYTTASLMIGFPTETHEDMMDTYRLIRNCKPDVASAYIVLPLPGTKVWDYALQTNQVRNDMDFSKLKILDLKVSTLTEYESYDGPLLMDNVTKKQFLEIAGKIKKELSLAHAKSLFLKEALSFKAIKFALLRPKQAILAVFQGISSLYYYLIGYYFR